MGFSLRFRCRAKILRQKLIGIDFRYCEISEVIIAFRTKNTRADSSDAAMVSVKYAQLSAPQYVRARTISSD